MTRARIAIGALGVVIGAFGAWFLLSRQDFEQLKSAAIWLVAGVVLHDFVLAPVLILAFVLVTRWLPAAAKAPSVVAVVVLGTLTIATIPVLGTFGERPDNATLLPRPYAVSWLVVLAVTLVAVVVASVVRSRRSPSVSPRGTGAERVEGAEGSDTPEEG